MLGWDVVRSRAAASESDLPYVGLYDLIGSALPEVAATLPGPLRRALDVVLRRADPPAGGVDALAVNVAVMEVLATMAGRKKVLLVLDDLQWLDLPTRHVLEFAMGRLPPAAVGVLAASRESDPETLALLPQPVEPIEVVALTAHEIADLVALRAGRVPSPRSAAQLHRLSGGNPFLALELARDRRDRLWDAEEFSVPERYRRLLADRLSVLSPAGRRTALAAALLSRPTASSLVRAGGRSGLEEAESTGVLHISTHRLAGDAVEFDHPLLAAACRDAAGPVAVREMHLALASLADDPVERAHHVALGTVEANPALADEVEAAAHLAAQRVALAPAAELAGDALRMTPGPALADRARRAVLSARWFVQCGEQARAQAVIRPLLEELPPGPLRARSLLAYADALGQEIAGMLPLVREAIEQPGLEPEVALEARMALASALMVHGDLAGARMEAIGAGDAAAKAGLTEAVAAAQRLEAETGLFLGVPLDETPAWITAQHTSGGALVYEHPDRVQAFAASWRDDQAEAQRLLQHLIRVARERGELSSEAALSMHRAEFALRDGHIDAAAVWAEHSYRLSADGVRDQLPLYIRAHVAAWRGDLDEARRLATTGLAMADQAADSIFGAQCLLVLGFTEVSAGRFEDAARHESRLRDLMARMGWGHPGALRWQGDAVEAFLATGRVEEASEVTARLWGEADRLDLRGCRSLAARCDGLIHARAGDVKLAEDSLVESLALMTGLDMPLERARTLFALGVSRRRNRQKATATAALREARDLFSRSGAQAWVGKVDAELQRAAGGRAGEELTVGERSVAELAAAGETNREIGARLYLSPKTVETVLTRVYRKLGVRSRTQLARRLHEVE
jgi:DNA-binding CsgD family transcriptional regulator